MTAKEYLSRYGDISREIMALLEERQRVEDILLRLSHTTNPNRVQGGPLPTPGAAIEKLVDLDKEIEARAERLKETRREIVQTVDSIKSEKARAVLRMKYLDNMTIAAIAEKLDRSDRHVKRVHKWALAIVADKIAEKI